MMDEERKVEGAVEVIARAMCEQHIREVRRWDTDPAKMEANLPAAVDVNWHDHVAVAKAAITAITEAGFAIVPVEPTGHAMDCGAYKLPGVDAESKQAKARDIYRAMIEAGRVRG